MTGHAEAWCVLVALAAGCTDVTDAGALAGRLADGELVTPARFVPVEDFVLVLVVALPDVTGGAGALLWAAGAWTGSLSSGEVLLPSVQDTDTGSTTCQLLPVTRISVAG